MTADARTLERLDWLLVKCATPAEPLTQWEKDFLVGIRERRKHYGDDVKVSDRQWEILEEIGRKAA